MKEQTKSNLKRLLIGFGILGAILIGFYFINAEIDNLNQSAKENTKKAIYIQPMVVGIDQKYVSMRYGDNYIGTDILQKINGTISYVKQDGDAYLFNASATNYYLEVAFVNSPLTINLNKTLDNNLNPFFTSGKTDFQIPNITNFRFELNKTMVDQLNTRNEMLAPIATFYLIINDKVNEMNCDQLHSYVNDNIAQSDQITQLARDRIILNCLPQGNQTQ